jgi:c-di-GMP-binding flagellar brake protein YcgR
VVRADRRLSVRVELTDPVYATFTSPTTTVSGRLHDMSVTGIAFTVDTDPGIAISEAGTVTVTLPIGLVSLPAALLKVTPQEEGVRLAFQIEPNRESEEQISRYIFQRQVEIIKELKDHPGIGTT